MKTHFILTLAATLGLQSFASAQGLADVLKGSREPSDRPAPPVSKPPRVQPAQPKQPAPAKPKFQDSIGKLKKNIAELETRKYQDMPKISRADAKHRLELLRERQAKLKATISGEVATIVGETQAEADQFKKRWQTLSDALSDGKKRTDAEWQALLNPAKKTEPNDKKRIADAEKAAQTRLGLGLEEKPKAPPTDAEKAGTFSEMLSGKTVPEGMSPATWARILDAHGKDRHRLEANARRNAQRAESLRQTQLAESENALQRAEQQFQRMAESGQTPSEFEQRHLNWQLEQARLEQSRQRLADLERLEQGAAQQPSFLQEGTGPNPLDPGEAIRKFVTNAMRLVGAAPAPMQNEFDQLSDDELDELVHQDYRSQLEPDTYARNMARTAVDRYRRRLDAINQALDSIPETLDREEQELIRDRNFRLNLQDDIDGIGHTDEAAAKREQALRNFRNALALTREQRMTDRRAELEAHRAEVVKSLEGLQTRFAEAEARVKERQRRETLEDLPG